MKNKTKQTNKKRKEKKRKKLDAMLHRILALGSWRQEFKVIKVALANTGLEASLSHIRPCSRNKQTNKQTNNPKQGLGSEMARWVPSLTVGA